MSLVTSRSRLFWVTCGATLLTLPLGVNAFNPTYVKMRHKTFEDRTVIVTGATGNIGRAIAGHLAFYKLRVIMACRDLEECKAIRRQIVLKTGNKAIACRHLDLENIDSINRFADEMIKTEPHIDILINNAAVKHAKEKELTKYGIEKNYFVNFVAPFLLTFRLLDKLKESAAITNDSRIINVTGKPKKDWDIDLNDINFERREYKPDVAYKQSKLALAYFTILMNESLGGRKSALHVFGFNPGFKRTTTSLFYPVTFMETMSGIMDTFYKQDTERAIQPLIKCCIDDQIISKDNGKLFSYFNLTTGWGEAAKNTHKGKLIWNQVADLLLNLKDEPVVAKKNGSANDQATNGTQKAETNTDKKVEVTKTSKDSGGKS